MTTNYPPEHIIIRPPVEAYSVLIAFVNSTKIFTHRLIRELIKTFN